MLAEVGQLELARPEEPLQPPRTHTPTQVEASRPREDRAWREPLLVLGASRPLFETHRPVAVIRSEEELAGVFPGGLGSEGASRAKEETEKGLASSAGGFLEVGILQVVLTATQNLGGFFGVRSVAVVAVFHGLVSRVRPLCTTASLPSLPCLASAPVRGVAFYLFVVKRPSFVDR